MSFLNKTGLSYLWTKITNYLTGAHVSTSAISEATTVDEALTKLQTKTGTATLTTTAENLSGAVNELNSGLDAQSQQIEDLETQAGNAALTTTAQTLSDGINEINDKVQDAMWDSGILPASQHYTDTVIDRDLLSQYKFFNLCLVVSQSDRRNMASFIAPTNYMLTGVECDAAFSTDGSLVAEAAYSEARDRIRYNTGTGGWCCRILLFR